MVFCDSRARTEELVHSLGELGVRTFISHSSLSREIRRSSEQAFTLAQEGVIVATCTLELGIDLGDLDRVIQIDAPSRVASFLQRLGRTGRRPKSRANCLFLATHDQAFLRAAGLLQLWSEGFVEPVEPPPQPFHVLAQQLMAMCLQEGGASHDAWRTSVFSMPGFANLGAEKIQAQVRFLYGREILFQDGGRTWLGAEGERRYQRRNFMELLSMITDSPLFTVIHGQRELGQVDRASFMVQQDRATVLLLAGRSWQVEHIDWRRKRCWVQAVEDPGRSRWLGEGPPLSYELCQAIRRVLRSDATPPGLTRRGHAKLKELRMEFAWLAATDAASVFQTFANAKERWWTFAGLLGNATILGILGPHLEQTANYDNLSIVLPEAAALQVRQAMDTGQLDLSEKATPQVDKRAIEALKFSECLPADLLDEVITARWSDHPAATAILSQPNALVQEA